MAFRPPAADRLGQRIGRIVNGFGGIVEREDPQIDLGHLKTGELEAEIETEEREVFKLLRQQAVVPLGIFGELVVGDPEGAGLRWGQVIQAQRRHLGPAELLGRQQPTVTGDHVAVAIDQDRDIEPKNPASIAKGISSAYLPIAATVVKNDVFQSFYGEPSENRQVAQVSTYGGTTLFETARSTTSAIPLPRQRTVPLTSNCARYAGVS